MDIATLAEQIRGMEHRQEERHRDTAARLQRIEDQVRRTNGTVIRHDEQIRTLFGQIKELAARIADAIRSRLDPPASTAHATQTDRRRAENLAITRRDVTVFVAGGTALAAAWHVLMGLLR